jgi:hypothetical protein
MELRSETIIQINAWSEFEEKLRWLDSQIIREGPIDKRLHEPLFRGQAHHRCQWRLETTLERFASTEKIPAALSLFLSHDELLADKNGDQGVLFEFRIPARERTTALRKLELMNINPYSLFASEDALVRTVARRECYFKSWEF